MYNQQYYTTIVVMPLLHESLSQTSSQHYPLLLLPLLPLEEEKMMTDEIHPAHILVPASPDIYQLIVGDRQNLHDQHFVNGHYHANVLLSGSSWEVHTFSLFLLLLLDYYDTTKQLVLEQFLMGRNAHHDDDGQDDHLVATLLDPVEN
jgi:hypothetical protein